MDFVQLSHRVPENHDDLRPAPVKLRGMSFSQLDLIGPVILGSNYKGRQEWNQEDPERPAGSLYLDALSRIDGDFEKQVIVRRK